ncbi:hypothetical protein ASH01_17065 [Terrabacter sp. Soil811]|nr:hypothetical protein ASH01_17065 [Terrabacter sp. Soil811]
MVPWDYFLDSTVSSWISIDEAAFLESTGLPTTAGVLAVMQVDCRATGLRKMVAIQLPGGDVPALLQVHLGPHQCAQQIEVTHAILLDRTSQEDAVDLVAFRRGSRLLTSMATHRFLLEGSASTFPTEAFDFGPAGLPPDAAWKLQFDPESLDEPYLGAVRLFINSSHPSAPELLSGRPSLTQSVLFHSIVEHLLLIVAERFPAEAQSEYQADSVGEALEHLAKVYLGVPLTAAISLLVQDRAETICRLQAATSFLAANSR